MSVVWALGRRQTARPVVTPVAVERRAAPPAIAAVPWSDAQIVRLRATMRRAFAPALAGADRWSLVVLGNDGRVAYAERADRAVAPASVAKLVVAASALDVLGPAFRYHTIFAGRSAIDPAGSLSGNLWLGGSGDPSLQTADLRAGVGSLARAGLRSIRGGVAVDPTAMGGPPRNPHWDADDANQDYAAPINALSVDGDTIESRKTVGNVEEHFWTPVRDVPRYAAAVVQRLVRGFGISTADPPAVSPAPLDSIVLWDHASAPLRVLERHMLVFSDNHYAEQLLRTLGGEGAGAADDAGGLAVERAFLSERGIPVPGFRLEDGSGLSAGNRIAAVTLARILADAQARGGDASLYGLLPLGGRQGTLADYDFTTALGRVRAKSGHITGVSSLAGYAVTAHHGRVVFAFLVNGSPGDPDAAIVRAIDGLVQF
ncbi:MAG TPA: D-alanyl-D-alanine carboxypeptidase/D-alanyl-D-alanine-endopeptidase [Candidatus Tumulicola sp.]